MHAFTRMLRDESGAAAAEYAMLLAIVGTAIAVASLYLGQAISDRMNTTGNCINSPSAANC